MSGDKRNPPLGLDMPFGEALLRFIGVDRNELTMPERQQTTEEGIPMSTWVKRLSVTDAQQPTQGSIVPYLRLTKGTIQASDWQTWFRDTFFANAAWSPSTVNSNPVEQTKIPFEVTIRDMSLGAEAMTVTHQPERAESHSAPSTWIHWSSTLRQILEANDFTDKPVRLTRTGAGAYQLDIDAAADAGV